MLGITSVVVVDETQRWYRPTRAVGDEFLLVHGAMVTTYHLTLELRRRM